MPKTTPQGWIAIKDLLRHLSDQVHHSPAWRDMPPPYGWRTWETLFPPDLDEGALGMSIDDVDEYFGESAVAVETLLDALAEQLATGTVPSAGVDHETGELTMLRPACWRLIRYDEAGRQLPGPIYRARLGEPVPYHDEERRERLCHPLLAERDIARFFGVEQLPEIPPETPPGWPERMRALPEPQRTELVGAFVQGYAAATLHATGKPVLQRDDHMEEACKAAVPGCTQAEVWKAHSALSPALGLRNRSPEERATGRGERAT
jgi:hypothetical protein